MLDPVANDFRPVNFKEIKMKKSIILATASCLAFLSFSAQAYTGEALAKEARITMNQARGIALKAHPGKITDIELEKEKGGSGLRYSFDIRNGKATQEVGVDAVTGKVLENDREGPDHD